MSSTRDELSRGPKSWQGSAWVQLLAAILGVFPLYSSLIILQLISDRSVSIQGFTLYLTVIAPLGIVIALLLLRFLCGEHPRDLNLRPGKLSRDLLAVFVRV